MKYFDISISIATGLLTVGGIILYAVSVRVSLVGVTLCT